MKQIFNSQYDRMTKSSVVLLIIELGIPTTLSMLVTSIYNIVDTMFVGRLGTSASGAAGIVFGFMSILQAVGFMIGQGSGSIISRYLGKKEITNAKRIASTGFFLAIFIGFIIGILSLIFIRPLIYLLGSTDTIYRYAKDYIFYILLVSPFVVSSFVMNNILRYEGRAFYAMFGLISGAVINIFGDYFLMFHMGMGIAGAGLSTALSQVISFSILLYMCLSGRIQSRITIRYISLKLKDYFDIVTTGFPSLLRQGLASIATMILNQEAGLYGDAAIAAMSIVSRIAMFFFQIGTGIGQGYQPVCAFNYGARRYDRVKKAFFATFIIEEIVLCLLAVFGFSMVTWEFNLFSDDIEVLGIGIPALRYRCIALVFQPLLMVSSFTFQCTGQRMIAAFLAMLRNGLYYIPLLLLLPNIIGLFGIQISQSLADVCAFVTVIPFIVNYMKILSEKESAEEKEENYATGYKTEAI